MHRSLSLIAALSIVLAAATVSAQGFIISEYVEGSSYNKALEFWNGTGSAIDLSTWEVWIYFNGNTEATQKKALSGILENHGVYVFCAVDADPAIQAVADLVDDDNIWFNGDDAVAVGPVSEGVMTPMDILGQIGFDPGSEWGAGEVSTQDNTIRRMPDVCVGDMVGSDPFDPILYWVGFPTNTFDGLGWHDHNCGPTATEPSTWGTLKQTYR
jgi:predicted extracellular nuclease